MILTWLRGFRKTCDILSALYFCLFWANGHQPLECGDSLWGASTHSFKHVFTRGHIKHQKHYISTIPMPMFTRINRMVTFYEELTSLSTCRRPMDTELDKVVSYCYKLPPLKSHDPLITWPTWRHVTIWSIYIFTFTRLMATKTGG